MPILRRERPAVTPSHIRLPGVQANPLPSQAQQVEAKFRTGAFNDKVVWCNDKQLVSYLDYNKEKPVFLILGMGDNPEYPEFLSLMPLTQVKYTGLFLSQAEKFEINLDKPVSSKILWTR